MTGKFLRFWQRANHWSINLDGTLTWFSTDDRHHRDRKVDIEISVPKWVWRPYCWWRGEHEEYYRFCIYCDKLMRPKKKPAER